ncbi:MAG TPA: hypothetical protein VK868_03975, partial [Pyrinomonadaceae bacterium]|nr:hypothetical protein [Pyrinomonadaceae bacterium]
MNTALSRTYLPGRNTSSGQFPRRTVFTQPANAVSHLNPIFKRKDIQMKSLRSSRLRIKLSVVSRNRKYWLLLSVTLVKAVLMWTSAASAACNFLS